MKILEYIQFTKKQREEFKLFDKTFPYKIEQGITAIPNEHGVTDCELITICCDPSDEEKFREDTKKIEEHGYSMIKAMKMGDGLVNLMFDRGYLMPQRGRLIRKMVHIYYELVENWPKFWRISWSGKCACCNEDM